MNKIELFSFAHDWALDHPRLWWPDWKPSKTYFSVLDFLERLLKKRQTALIFIEQYTNDIVHKRFEFENITLLPCPNVNETFQNRIFDREKHKHPSRKKKYPRHVLNLLKLNVVVQIYNVNVIGS